MLDKIVRDFRDEDRHTIVGMAIVASAGREARETLVWTLVGRWGVMWPPGKDEYGKVIPSEYEQVASLFGLIWENGEAVVDGFVISSC
jgi:hypothetical protein